MDVEAKLKREEDILKKVVQILERRLHPPRIILFGSRAKGIPFQGNPDFDIAVDREKVDFWELIEIEREIDAVSGLYKVDIVFLKSVKESFRNIILETGKVVYEKGSTLCN